MACDCIKEALEKTARALEELKAIVWGECPSLLNEDSGGNARLDSDIDEALEAAEAALATLSQPTADRREIVARIIDPFAMDNPGALGCTRRRKAREKADAILAALDGGR